MGTSIKQKYCSLRIADRKISYGMEISHRGFLSFFGGGGGCTSRGPFDFSSMDAFECRVRESLTTSGLEFHWFYNDIIFFHHAAVNLLCKFRVHPSCN